MSFLMFVAVLAGFVAGGVLGIAGVSGAMLWMRRIGRTRAWVPLVVIVVGLVFTALFIVLINHDILPLEPVAAGSDYDIAMKNSFIQGIAIGASPGLGALCGAAAALLCPRRPPEDMSADEPEFESDATA